LLSYLVLPDGLQSPTPSKKKFSAYLLAERAVLETVILDPDQPARLIRNGDIAREPAEQINSNTTAKIAVLKYLAYCPDGIHEEDVGSKRYKCESPGPDHPYGFSFDDLFRGVVSGYACIRQREKTNYADSKKGVADGGKAPTHREEVIRSYVKASKAHYGEFHGVCLPT
jgi:hypothetical protein